jgi:hypothetical protein
MVWCLYSYFVHGFEAWDCLTPTVGLKVLHHCGYLPLIYPCRDSRGGHRHMQVGRLADANHSIERINIVIILTTEGKNQDLYIDQFRSVANPISRDRIFHFQLKKNRDLYLDFSKFVNILLKISSM